MERSVRSLWSHLWAGRVRRKVTPARAHGAGPHVVPLNPGMPRDESPPSKGSPELRELDGTPHLALVPEPPAPRARDTSRGHELGSERGREPRQWEGRPVVYWVPPVTLRDLSAVLH